MIKWPLILRVPVLNPRRMQWMGMKQSTFGSTGWCVGWGECLCHIQRTERGSYWINILKVHSSQKLLSLCIFLTAIGFSAHFSGTRRNLSCFRKLSFLLTMNKIRWTSDPFYRFKNWTKPIQLYSRHPWSWYCAFFRYLNVQTFITNNTLLPSKGFLHSNTSILSPFQKYCEIFMQ